MRPNATRRPCCRVTWVRCCWWRHAQQRQRDTHKLFGLQGGRQLPAAAIWRPLAATEPSALGSAKLRKSQPATALCRGCADACWLYAA